jgi:hypothetical protein
MMLAIGFQRCTALKIPATEYRALYHLFPASHEDGNGEKVPAATKVWDSNTLLAPAYLSP